MRGPHAGKRESVSDQTERLPAPPENGEDASTETERDDGRFSRLKRWTVRLLILGLVASLFYLLAERNRRFYFLSSEGAELVVSRGTWMPSWKAPYVPEDPQLVQAYAPIPLPHGVEIPQKRFDERQDLDQALFEILIDWAETRILADEPEALGEGTGYLERAARLPGISGEQYARIRALRAEVAFSEGRSQLVEALTILESVNERLGLAAVARTARGRKATRLLEVMLPATQSLTEALEQMRAEPGSDRAHLRSPDRSRLEGADSAKARKERAPKSDPKAAVAKDVEKKVAEKAEAGSVADDAAQEEAGSVAEEHGDVEGGGEP